MPEGRKRKLKFRNGREYPGLHQRYFMEHAGCIEEETGKHFVTSGQMCSFAEGLKWNEYGMLTHYKRQLENRASGDPPVTISRNMVKVIKNFRNKWGYMLQDVEGFVTFVCKCLQMIY